MDKPSKDRPDANTTAIGVVLIVLGIALAILIPDDGSGFGFTVVIAAGMAIAGLFLVMQDAFTGGSRRRE